MYVSYVWCLVGLEGKLSKMWVGIAYSLISCLPAFVWSAPPILFNMGKGKKL